MNLFYYKLKEFEATGSNFIQEEQLNRIRSWTCSCSTKQLVTTLHKKINVSLAHPSCPIVLKIQCFFSTFSIKGMIDQPIESFLNKS